MAVVVHELQLADLADYRIANAVSARDDAGVPSAFRQLTQHKLAFETLAQTYGFKICGASMLPGRL